MHIQGTPVLDSAASRAADQGAPPTRRDVGEVRLYKVADVMEILSLSRGRIYELLRSGRLRSVSEGRSRRVTPGAIAEYVELLNREARQEAASR
jgi:excisionase family DNA binding protein